MNLHPEQVRGLSLVELVISLVVLSVVTGGIFTSLDTGMKTMLSSSVLSTIDLDANRTLYRISRALSVAGAQTLLPPALPPSGSSSLSFQRNTGYVNGAAVWGPLMAISWVPDPDDPPDGVDNNENGLVDEGQIVQRTNVGQPGEETQIWLRGVPAIFQGETQNNLDDNANGLIDEGGLSFTVQGSRIIIRLTLQRSTGTGRIISRTAQTTITLLN